MSMDNVRRTLEKYPSSFKTKDALKKLTIEQIDNKIKNSLSYLDTSADVEKPSTWNFLSFLYFCKDEKEKADEFNSKVLGHRASSTNIISIANKAWFALEKRNLVECKSLCDQLGELKADKTILLIAKAEIAFTYSRLGSNSYLTALNLFKEVIEDYDNGTPVPIEYACIWMYNYALTLKRRLHVSNLHDDEVDLSDGTYKHILGIYCRVIQMKGDQECLKRVKARAYVDIGLIALNIEHSVYPREMKNLLPKDSDLEFEVEDYFTEALHVCPNDVYVLERSAKYFRYMGEFAKAEHLLVEALEIRKTSFIYHHLGLILLKKLEKENFRRHRSTGNYVSTPRNPLAFAHGHIEVPVYDTARQEAERHHANANANKENPRYNKFESLSSSSAGHNAFCPSQDASWSFIKSPLRPRLISYKDNKGTVDKIIEYYDEAAKLSTNCAALYDKGLLYRQTKQNEKAFVVFENMTKSKDDSVSLVYLANAYEQAALCLIALLEDGKCIPEETQTEMETKLKTYLISSIEISSNWIAKFPSLKNSWNSLPTLGKFLNTESNNEEDLNHCVFYYRKIQDYTGAIQALDKLVSLATDDFKKAEIFQEEAKTYLCKCDYDNAVMTFWRYMNLIPNRLDQIDPYLYSKVHIKAGLDALQNGQEEIAKLRIRNAFDFVQTEVENVDPFDDERNEVNVKEKYDLFILCDIDDDINGQRLMVLLNRLGLNTTSNADNVNILPGTPENEGIKQLMEESKNFAIINDAKEMTKETKYFVRIVKKLANSKPHDSAVVAITRPEEDVPAMLHHTAVVGMNLEALAEEDCTNDCHILESIESLLMTLLCVGNEDNEKQLHK